MSFDYDPTKAAANFRKHGVSFADAESVFSDPLAVTIEDASALGEARFVTVGLGSVGEVLVVVYSERDGHVRLISARRATPRERRNYET